MSSAQLSQESDAIDGTTHPRLSLKLVGHHEAFQTFSKCRREGRLHHAWILSGPKGIGKATLAWRLAADLTNEADQTQQPNNKSASTQKQIEALSLPNLFLCRRPYDSKTNRLKKFITIDEVRKLKTFFQFSATENKWRIAIVDCADELNKSATNALLKLLEEPPKKSIILIISNQPAKLPATLRSRCRSLHLKKLSTLELQEVLKLCDYNIRNEPDNDKLTLSIIADGSSGMAITAINQNGIAIFKSCLEVLATFPNFDRKQIIQLAGTVKNNTEKFKFMSSILLLIIARLALLKVSVKNVTPTSEERIVVDKLLKQQDVSKNLAYLYFDLSELFLACEELNLDATNQIFTAFIKIEKTLSGSYND